LFFEVFFANIFFEVLDNDFEIAHLFQEFLMVASALEGVSGSDEGGHAVEDPELSE
jgi:hypothetical protein